MQRAKALLLTSVIVLWLSICLVPVCLGIRSLSIFERDNGLLAAVPRWLRWSIAVSTILTAGAAVALVVPRRTKAGRR